MDWIGLGLEKWNHVQLWFKRNAAIHRKTQTFTLNIHDRILYRVAQKVSHYQESSLNRTCIKNRQ